MPTDSIMNGIPMTVWCRTSETIHGFGSCTEIPGHLFIRHHASTKWVPFCIVYCTFPVVTVHVASLYCFTGTYYGRLLCSMVHRVTVTTEWNWRLHYQINCNDCKMSFSFIGMYRVVLYIFINLLLWIYYHKLGKQMW